jgi:sigma-54 specific flagellar transcriptional regulator A
MTDIIHSPGSPISALVHACKRIAARDATVFIAGETGVGKEVFAQYIHENSACAQGPFVPVHCAAIPENLIESELFGHKRGAFTDAKCDKPGLIARAEGGTLFLDEIGELSPGLQVKLLRVLQERCYESVGATSSTQANFRLVTATNKDLAVEVETGKFRQDLYYRLYVCPIELPPLRKRRADIEPLFRHFWTQHGETRGLDPAIFDLFKRHSWPGNVRELKNVVERLSACAEGVTIEVEHLPSYLRFVATPTVPEIVIGTKIEISRPIDLPRMLQELEDAYINAALTRTEWNKKEAAALLGLNRTTLVEKLKRRKWR